MKYKIVIFLLLGCIATQGRWLYAQEPASLPLEDLQVFAEVFGKIKSEYVDEVSDTVLLRDAIQGMLAGLDPHSEFLDPVDFEEIKTATDGRFGGLGLEVTTESGLVKVVAPIYGTPAYAAGIQAGDFILMLNGQPLRGMSLREVVEKMRGVPGSEISLTVSRAGFENPKDITLVRSVIKVISVRGEVLAEGIGYVRVSSFQSGTAQSLRNEIKLLGDAYGQPLKGLILDLRNNPGGVFTGAVEVTDIFLDAGEIVSTRSRRVAEARSFTAKPDDVIDNAPMVVLVNGGSASASEIVAGALQDHRRAIIMGTQTFGKGSVQTIIPMHNGSALKMTTARYYTPSDRSIQAKGITPDIITEQAEWVASQNPRDELSESDLFGHLKNEGSDPDGESEAGVRMADLMENDRQLREAVNLIKGMSLVKTRSGSADG